MRANKDRGFSQGFTLLELMIVVAIITILATIAIPNFIRFSSRARQAEAKSNLKGFFTSEKSYFAEFGSYACKNFINGVVTASSCGFTPEANNFYVYAFAGYPYSAQKAVQGGGSASTCTPSAGGTAATQTAFSAGACSNIDEDATLDQWSIDQNNNLLNTVNDVIQ